MSSQSPKTSDEPSPARKRLARRIFTAASIAAAAVFCLLVWRSIRTSTSTGLIGNIAASFIAGLLIWVAGAWASMSVALSEPARAPDAAGAEELPATLGLILEQLEKVRVAALAKVRSRLFVGLPVGVVAVFCLWLLPGKPGHTDSIGNLFLMLPFGAAAGFYWASRIAIADYRGEYLARVLPVLATRLGTLACRFPAQLDVSCLSKAGLFGPYGEAKAELEIFGTYRDLPISIATLMLKTNASEHRTVTFNGLIVKLMLSRSIVGTIAVIHKGSTWQHMTASLRAGGVDPVQLEDAAFRAVYDVLSNDQVAARALLTPAFMERFRAMGNDLSMLGDRPVALLRNNELLIAIPRAGADDFATPSLWQASVGRRAVIELYNHLARVLALTDTTINLDSATQGVALVSDRRKSNLAALTQRVPVRERE